MKKAKEQALRYARALPTSEGWPPFLVVVDVGYCIDKKGKQLLFTPTPHFSHLRQPPRFSLTNVNRLWLLNETVDP